MIKRRFRQFVRDPKNWFLLSTPFITATFGFLIVFKIQQAFPDTDPDVKEALKDVLNYIKGLMFSLFLLIGYCVIAGIFLFPIVQDREFKMRYVLNFIGMKPFAYWFGSLVVDYGLATLPSILFMVIVAVGGVEALSHNWYIVGLTILSFLFPLVTLTYCMTFFFKKSERAFRLIGTVYMLTGYMIPVLLLNLQPLFENDHETLDLIESIFAIFIPFLPFFNTMIGIVISYIIQDDQTSGLFLTTFSHYQYSIPLMLTQGCVFFAIAYFVDIKYQNYFKQADSRVPKLIPPQLESDSDVLAEQRRVEQLSPSDCNIRANNLHKVYPNGFAAVNGTSFGLAKQEVLGLLGPNGAGKSTTFNMVTMDITRSEGDIHLLGETIQNVKPQEYGNRFGICPQYNAIWGKLTVDEHFEFITQIKGLSDEAGRRQTKYLKDQLELNDYGDFQADNLSGGNKRKLCCAICLLASPQITFLDEPTTGVDPVARRSLFNLLRKLKDSSVVLTTHRMDEAEALCDKIAIQVNGKFVCFGSPSHLKEKYGQGYKVDIKMEKNAPASQFDDSFKQVLPFIQRIGEANEEGIVEFKILVHEFPLAEVFRQLNFLQEKK